MSGAGFASEWLTADFGYSVRVDEVLEERHTPYQHLEVLRTPQFGTVLRLDGALQCSERDEFLYHEALVHTAAMAHPEPRRALVIGGGDGGTAEELLKHPTIQDLSLVELDADVVDAARRHLRSVNDGIFEPGSPQAARFQWSIGDGLEFLARQERGYDLLFLDLTDPGGPSLPLYQPDFFRLCRRMLGAQGILALHVAAPWSQPQRAACLLDGLREAFGHVTPFLANVPVSGGPWLMACCSASPHRLDQPRAAQRCAQLLGRPLRYYTPAVHAASLALPPYLQQTLHPAAAASTLLF